MNKLFTHTDLDGVGCAIIAKLVYGDEIDISFCDSSNANKMIENCHPDNYDHIDITNLSIDEKLARSIDENYANQVNLFDHYFPSQYLNKYSWVDARAKEENGGLETSGTKIYYDHIGKYIEDYSKLATESFVKYVTAWETQQQYGDSATYNIAKNINALFNIYGIDKFTKWAIEKIKTGFFLNNCVIVSRKIYQEIQESSHGGF